MRQCEDFLGNLINEHIPFVDNYQHENQQRTTFAISRYLSRSYCTTLRKTIMKQAI